MMKDIHWFTPWMWDSIRSGISTNGQSTPMLTFKMQIIFKLKFSLIWMSKRPTPVIHWRRSG